MRQPIKQIAKTEFPYRI